MKFSTGHDIVDAVGELFVGSGSGNFVPHSWYQHIRYTNKRGEYTDPWAVLILADIAYWYRPVEVRDETTGHLIGFRKKFAEDKLQRSLEAFSDLLHCSARVARASLDLLETLNLVDIELRAIQTAYGTIPTAMFIGINPDRLAEITHNTSNPVLLLWSQPGEEGDDEDLTYPFIQYWVPDTDWFELPQSAVDEICARPNNEVQP